METVLTNARVVLEDEVLLGTVSFDEGGIRAVERGISSLAGALDAGGDYVAPGLIEMHTDNLEKHLVPRPAVVWPDALAAAMAHDLQMAAAGVTTVHDALCIGYADKDRTRAALFPQLIEAVCHGVSNRAFRVDHRLHLRCELTGEGVAESIEPHLDNPLVKLLSLMDHTPGQRQWRSLDAHKTYVMGTSGGSETEYEAHLRDRLAVGALNARRNRPPVVEMCRSRRIPLATHDDTTEAHVAQGAAAGAVICEFPTTMEAAVAAKSHDLATVAGAPNIVRGGSHSGGVSATALAERGVLDGLSSDYVPSSLLQAVDRLTREQEMPWPRAMGMVTWRIADMLGLADRGRLKAGLRADVLWFGAIGKTPIVRGLWSAGRRVL